MDVACFNFGETCRVTWDAVSAIGAILIGVAGYAIAWQQYRNSSEATVREQVARKGRRDVALRALLSDVSTSIFVATQISRDPAAFLKFCLSPNLVPFARRSFDRALIPSFEENLEALLDIDEKLLQVVQSTVISIRSSLWLAESLATSDQMQLLPLDAESLKKDWEEYRRILVRAGSLICRELEIDVPSFWSPKPPSTNPVPSGAPTPSPADPP